MKILKIVSALLLLAATFAGGYVFRAAKPAGAAAAARRVLYYVDPMHPAYKSDKPGIAPDCGMALEPVYADDGASAATTGDRKVLYYRDPRDHQYVADTPGLNPETGNTLEPVFAEQPATAPAGAIRISPERQQVIGVKFSTVEAGAASRTIRAVGKVAVDETRVGHVHTRIDGWIEKVFVNFTGDVVRQGEPMLTVYSPDMLASQEELLLAARARESMPSLFEATRRRLQLWNLGDDDIEQVLRTGQPIRSVTIHAPMSGYVTERNVFPNQKVTSDSDLYTITDLSRIWIVADVFESDVTSIRVGDPAYVTFANGGTPSLGARVSYIQPEVDPMTRTLKVRLNVNNPGMRMKPDMFVNVEFGVVTTGQLTVPAEAVLDTGDRQTVFVDLGNGYLEARAVTIGGRFGERVAISSGLKEGERVVSAGTFLIDAESQLKAAAGSMGTPARPASATSSGKTGPASAKGLGEAMPEPAGHRHD